LHPKQTRYQAALRPDKIKTTFIIWNKKNQDQSCLSAPSHNFEMESKATWHSRWPIYGGVAISLTPP
ncbi:hypothetical protein, partial [Desulfobacter sp. UBA2225]|uniref:hypothetical protein n=1 Tax=Desulfobacter sp. UBA2225 TaxID=1961413 RepID=UPI00257A6C13